MVEITHCGRTVSGDVVGLDIRWQGDLVSQPSVLWSVLVSSDDGTEEVHLGHLRSGGRIDQFVDDRTTGRRHSLEPDADLDDDEIVLRFPTSVVGVAVDWPLWTAVITVDGQEVAQRVISLG